MASDNTYNEAMQKILSQLAIAGTLPDADIQFLAQIQAAITQNLREGATQTQNQPQGGMPPGGMQTPSPGMAQQGPGAPMPGLVPSAPNMDEIRRMIGATGAVQ